MTPEERAAWPDDIAEHTDYLRDSAETDPDRQERS